MGPADLVVRQADVTPCPQQWLNIETALQCTTQGPVEARCSGRPPSTQERVLPRRQHYDHARPFRSPS